MMLVSVLFCTDCSHPLRSGLSRGYSVKKANLNRCPPHSRGFAKQYSVFRKAQNGANPGVSQDSSRSVFRFNASRSPCLFGNLAGFHPQPTLFPVPLSERFRQERGVVIILSDFLRFSFLAIITTSTSCAPRTSNGAIRTEG